MPLTIFCAWPARRCNWRSARSNYAKSYTARRSCRAACAKLVNYKQAAHTAASTTIVGASSLAVSAPQARTSDQSFCATPCLEFHCRARPCSNVFCSCNSRDGLARIDRAIREQVRITFQIRRRWDFIEWREREYFTGHLKNENVFSERCALDCSELAKAVIAEGFQIHQEIRDLRMPGRSLIATRSCFMESRSRNVTVSPSAASFSPSVSKSTVTPNGVPISSWRR